MLNRFNKKRAPLLGFALAAAIFAAFIITSSIINYKRTRERMEQSLIRETLKIIEAFEASVRAGLTGQRLWNKEKLHALVMDTCKRADLNSFCFIDPNFRVFFVSQTCTTNYYDPSVTNLYNALTTQPYTCKFIKSACAPNSAESLCVTKPLLLDNAQRIGKRTFRFYQVFLDRKNQHKTLKEFRNFRNNVRALPLAKVCVPLDDINELKHQLIFRIIITGLIFFFAGSLIIYVLVIIQHHRVLTSALDRVRKENKQLIEGIQRADRLSLIGRMASTMAHDIRNPLGSIRGYTQLFESEFKKSNNSEMCEYAGIVISEVDRLNRIIKRTLQFSKPLKPDFNEASVIPVLLRAVELIKRDISIKNIELKLNISDDLPNTRIDEHLIAQTLLNLLLNAVDAMPDGGTLEVSAARDENGNIKITISDTGIGIPEDKLNDIFQPYYSTKPTGTGIGLAVVDNIIATHGGTIHVESSEGRGTVFIIILPSINNI